MRRAALAAAAAALAPLAPAGCGADDRHTLRVSAAASLKAAFTAYAPEDVALSFAGSDQLAAQIRQGARPDVYAAANVELPRRLHEEGLVERPLVFAGNELVLAVPRERSTIDALEDLDRPGVRVGIAARGVPAGDYARRVLTPAAARNVRTEEPDVAGVVGKIAQGAVDAGFVYATDVEAAKGRLRAIALPQAPPIRYAAAVVTGTDQPERARAFVEGLPAAPQLRDLGFRPPP